MKTDVIRLTRGMDLKQQLTKYVDEKEVQAGCIITSVGCVTRAKLRLADASIIKEFNRDYEIVSLVGTLSLDGVHLHISLADKEGKVIGGHLMEGTLVGTTTEIVIGVVEEFKFNRKFDEKTGYKELDISRLKK